MANPSNSTVQNLLPVQAYFDAQGNFQTFIGQGQPFYATANPSQSGLNITNSTINSTTIGATTPSTGVFTNIATTTGTITTAPSSATDIANKQYVDFYAAGLSWKQPVVTATSANITRSGLQTINAVTLIAGDRVLVKDQTTASENGIYIASATAWTYAVGADDWAEYVGAIVFIASGSLNGTAWYCTAQPGGTLGVTAMNWSNFSVASSYTAGTGLTLVGTQFSITNTGVSAATYGSASSVPVIAINAQGQATSVTNTSIAINGNQITSGTVDSARLSGSYTGITGLGTLTNLTVTNAIVGSITGNAATATTATNLSGGASGNVPYQTASGATTFLATGSNGQVLTLTAGIPSWTTPSTGTVTAVTASAPLASSGGSTPNITITQSSGSSDGYLSSANWTTFNNKANSGVNSDITSMTGLTGGISTPTFIQWGNGTGQSTVAGKQYYDPATGSHNMVMGGGNITQQVGEELFVYGKASSAIADSPLQIIYQTGTVGASGVITFAPTIASITDGTIILGVATESIALNDFGRITSYGVVRGITTNGTAFGETWADGDEIYYNPVTGNPTNIKPVAPNVKVSVGTLIKAGSGGSGSIQVEINHGSVLGGTDANVQITSVSNGQILSYDGGNGYWKNTDLTAGTGISISETANGVLTVASTVTAGITITDDTTTNATRYLAFTSATSGTIAGQNVASTKLQFNPSTGVLTSTSFTGAGTGLTGTASSLTAGTASALTTGNSYQVGSLGVGTAASGTAGEIRATNNVTAFYSSDRKFKENIRQIDNAIEKALIIGGKYFDWTDSYIQAKGGVDGYFMRKNDIGVIAQDVLEVLPEAVRTREDGSLAVDYQKLVSLAFAAIAELKAEINSLKGN